MKVLSVALIALASSVHGGVALKIVDPGFFSKEEVAKMVDSAKDDLGIKDLPIYKKNIEAGLIEPLDDTMRKYESVMVEARVLARLYKTLHAPLAAVRGSQD